MGRVYTEAVRGVPGAGEGIVGEAARLERAVEREVLDEGTGRWSLLSAYPTGYVTEEGRAVLMFMSRDITDRKRADERIRASLAEKEVLLGEIHHRVKDNMQLIMSMVNLQSATVSDPGTREVLKEIQHRVRSMALVHDMLYRSENVAEVDLLNYARRMGEDLLQAHGVRRDRVKFAVSGEGIRLPIDQATPCGLILNELITNALRHAFPD
ncbi:MAG TPA: histidine kinase, partial [Thermoplasmata archaeon]|nr:histidine kinase [Thermoplasmata archaeon]